MCILFSFWIRIEAIIMRANDNVLRVFTEDHVTRLTGLSTRQLRSWDRAGFFAPDFAYEDRRTPYSRVYSFRDVVGLRTIAVLRNRYRVSLEELKRVAEELVRRGYEHWAEMKLYVVNREVHFQRPGTDEVEGVWDRQLAMIGVIDVMEDVAKRADELRERSEEKVGQVEQHRFVARNAWVVAGTRIPTATIRRYSEAGYSVDDILREYPSLTEADVEAALAHEQRLAHSL
jgi:DNA-binding transcriptional MerR regulator